MKNNDLYLFLLLAFTIASANFAIAEEENEADPAEISIGERLFLETRFAQAYYANPNKADPVMNKTITTNQALDNPFRGKTMNCRSCHMVDEHQDDPAAGMRSYSDYAMRPPVPERKDGAKTSERNSMSMVNISLPHQTQEHAVFHFDGEFNSMEDLVRATFTGRNFGWLAGEDKLAIQHIANIIRQDKGKDELAQEFGGAYSTVLKGTDKNIAAKFRLPEDYRIDVASASDQKIFDAVAKLVSAYVTDLTFQLDDEGHYIGSPYDMFLKINNLPRKPDENETDNAYSVRLLEAINQLDNPRFVTAGKNKFMTHQQDFVFSKEELNGMKIFFSKGNKNAPGGNCVSCHTAPHFSDFGFHNTGLAQHNYDALHGTGEFNKIMIPDLITRNNNHNNFLPATSKHPAAISRFRTIAAKNKPGYTDLGLWNIFANPDMPAPQEKIKTIMCAQAASIKQDECSSSNLLNKTIAAFKTPVLRNLGHSNPYMHTGQFLDLQQTVRFYITSSIQARNQQLRNAEQNVKDININEKNVAPLVAFLKSLNEDYD
ncbi:MAG: hypothetical protein OQK58_04545 [Gammaproteobacteria bacterium]|nr:hypothetical protein [Gammaproteobacteria bacterium]